MTALENLQGHLRAFMEAEGLTQAALAERMGVSAPWLNQVLNGTRGTRIPTLEAAAARVGLSLADLFTPAKTHEQDVTSSDSPTGIDSRNPKETGEETHGTSVVEAGSLRRENARLRARILEHAEFIRDAADAIADFAAHTSNADNVSGHRGRKSDSS